MRRPASARFGVGSWSAERPRLPRRRALPALWILPALLLARPCPAAGRVVINEVHYHPADDTRTSEFVELHNFGNDAAALGGWVLGGGVTFVFPQGTTLAPGAFLVVAADRAGLLSTYPVDDALVLGNYSGSLANDGERIELWTSAGYRMSSVEYLDSDPWPEAPDGLGPSLERISSRREEADPQAWTASITVGGTPGEPNSVRVEDPPSPGVEVQLVPEGAAWRFLRGWSAPPADWNAIAFDDSLWESGPAGFGYEDGDDATVLSDMRGGYSTVWIRHEFEVSNPAAVESLYLSVLHDDGFAAWLNGTEIDRANLFGAAGAPVAHDAGTPATVEPPARRDADLSAARGLLVSGTNVLAVVGVNNSRDNADFSLHPSLRATVRTGLPFESTLVEAGAEWRLLRGSVAPPADWTDPSFVDADWETGLAGFGYGDGDDATVLGDMEGAYLTVSIRRGFQVADAAKIASLALLVDYDDGFVAWLNGIEVARANVSVAGHGRPADGSHEAGAAQAFAIQVAGVLRTGYNLLAIEGHNATLTSTDFSLSPWLTAMVSPDDPGPTIDPPPARPPRDALLNEAFLGAGGTGWVEIHNASADAVSLAGCRLGPFPSWKASYEFPAGTSLDGGAFLVVPEAALGFPLSGVPVLVLENAEGSFLDGLNPRTAPPGHSTGRWPDGTDNRYVFPAPTRGEPNVASLETRVVIHEIQFHPADSNTGGEFIELHNRSATDPVDLSGWSFTRGVEYDFPAGTVIPPGAYVVVARDPAAAAAFYGIPLPLGPYSGALANDAETLLLRDALKNPADRVRFADEGSWPETADGTGPSVELVHPAIENRYGPAWAASDGHGTPGAPNSRAAVDPPPIVVDVAHSPVIPAPADTVLVTATASDEVGIASVTLSWQPDGGSPSQVPMVDDGTGDDGLASNGIWGARIPAAAAGTIVVFWIAATAVGGQSVTVPADAPAARAFLYRVEASPPQLVRDVYRIIMKAADLNTLRTRSVTSDVLLDATFVADGRAWYNRGVRYRGRSARNCTPRSYRVQFDHDLDFHGIKRLNLNGCNTQRQWIGLDFLARTGIATPESWFRKLSINGTVDSGNHLRVEAVDDQFLERSFPADDEGGNLYRGELQANLDYRGEDFASYQPNYLKETNEEEADWQDIVDLCYVFDPDTTSAADFPAALEAAIDVDQWALYFAAFAILGSTEGSIQLDNGDDYYLYRRPSDGRWVLLPWDLDACFDQSQQVLFRPTVDQIERFLEHPRYAPLYWCHLERLLRDAFVTETVDARIDNLVPLFSAGVVSQLRQFASARYAYIAPRISPGIAVEATSGGRICGSLLFASSTEVSLEGLAPSCGTTELWVDGLRASFNPQTSRWSAPVAVAGPGPVRIEARDSAGYLVAATTLTAAAAPTRTILAGAIASDVQLVPGDSPYLVSGPTTVEPGATLRIAPGVELLLDEGAVLTVEGTLLAEGTGLEPIVVSPDACTARGEGIVIGPGSEGTVLEHVDLLGYLAVPGRAAGLVVDGSSATFRALRFRGDGTGGGIEVRGDARLTVEDSILEDLGVGILVDGASLEATGLRFRELGRAGLQLVAGATARVDRALILESTRAVEVSGGASVRASHWTVHGCSTAFDLGESGPGALVADSLIVWNTPAPIAGELASATVSWSDLQGLAVPGPGNIVEDPGFLDPGEEDFRISFYSPCRGTGKDGTDMGALPYEPTGETGTFLRCDANADSEVDLSDAIFTLIWLLDGGAPPPCPPSADCNSDGTANTSDPIFTLNHIFRGGPAPPEPYPACDEALVEECPGRFCAR